MPQSRLALSLMATRAMLAASCACSFAHNVAEGFVVAVPVLAGTGDKRLALLLTALSVRARGRCSAGAVRATAAWMTRPLALTVDCVASLARAHVCLLLLLACRHILLLQGLSEPIGALVGVLCINLPAVSSWMVPAIDASLCAVAGIMVAVSFQELLPQAAAGKAVTAAELAGGFAMGGAAIALTLLFL